jgi:hypothetical protein
LGRTEEGFSLALKLHSVNCERVSQFEILVSSHHPPDLAVVYSRVLSSRLRLLQVAWGCRLNQPFRFTYIDAQFTRHKSCACHGNITS